MTCLRVVAVLVAALGSATSAQMQTDDHARQVAQERQQAELEAPQLAEVLGLEPGMTVADIGTGGGAMAMVLGRLVGVTEPAAFNESLYATVKKGARLAIVDAPPGKGSTLPAGVPANRGGHGIPTAVVIDELTAVGFVHVRTIQGWPPGNKYPTVFLVLFEKR